MNFYLFISTVLNSKENTVSWCQEKGLLPPGMNCSKCGNPMYIYYNRKGIGLFRCGRTNDHPDRIDFSFSLARNTWFENSKLDYRKVLLLTYSFTLRINYEEITHEVRLSLVDTHLPRNLYDQFRS